MCLPLTWMHIIVNLTVCLHLVTAISSLNTSAFEIPAVTTNGMKNIEHYIDKALIEGKQWYRCKWELCECKLVAL